VVPKPDTPAVPNHSYEAVLEDEVVADKEDDAVDAIDSVDPDTGNAEGVIPRPDAVDTEEDISKTEVTTVSKSKLPVPKKSSQAVSPDEIKSVPSKSKLDRNPPKKKSNPELLANGTDDSVFNATAAAKPTNQDGQFLMNNANEGETNGHDDVEEIEEDGELVEDKPIDLQQAEEILDEDVIPKTVTEDRRRSLSSNK